MAVHYYLRKIGILQNHNGCPGTEQQALVRYRTPLHLALKELVEIRKLPVPTACNHIIPDAIMDTRLEGYTTDRSICHELISEAFIALILPNIELNRTSTEVDTRSPVSGMWSKPT